MTFDYRIDKQQAANLEAIFLGLDPLAVLSDEMEIRMHKQGPVIVGIKTAHKDRIEQTRAVIRMFNDQLVPPGFPWEISDIERITCEGVDADYFGQEYKDWIFQQPEEATYERAFPILAPRKEVFIQDAPQAEAHMTQRQEIRKLGYEVMCDLFNGRQAGNLSYPKNRGAWEIVHKDTGITFQTIPVPHEHGVYGHLSIRANLDHLPEALIAANMAYEYARRPVTSGSLYTQTKDLTSRINIQFQNYLAYWRSKAAIFS